MRVLILASLLAPQVAAAKCASPSAFVAAPSTAPPDPTVWVFVPNGWQQVSVTVTADGAPAAATATLISYGDGRHGFPATVHTAEAGAIALATPDLTHPDGRSLVLDFAVWALAIDADAGHVTVTLDAGWRPAETVIAIDPAWKRPADAAVKLEDLGVEQSSWTCSFQHTRNLRPSVDAPAYRVEWAASEAAWNAGERHTFILPRRMDAYFTEPVGEPMFELGHVNCNGYTFTRPGAAWMTVVGLYPDGSTTPEPIATRVNVPGR